MKNKVFFVLVFIWITAFSQQSYFLDKKMRDIDSLVYKNKCKNLMRKCYQIVKNDTIFNVIYDKYNIGQLTDYSNKRIRKEIFRNRNYNGTIIIHYGYKLNSISEIQKCKIDGFYKNNNVNKVSDSIKYSVKNIQSLKNKIHYPIDKKSLIKRGKQKSTRVNKCINKYQKKYDVAIFHYYFEGNPEFTSDLNWIKDKNKIIKNYFFKYFANYHFVIIKPNGQFIQIGGIMTPSNINKLIKRNDWSKIMEDLEKSEIKRKPIGFFKMPHNHTCL